MDATGIGTDGHAHNAPEPRPWGEQVELPEGYVVKAVDRTEYDRKYQIEYRDLDLPASTDAAWPR